MLVPMRPRTHQAITRRLPAHTTKPAPDRRRYMVASWRRLRLMVLRRNPFCTVEGCDLVAVDVDHIKPVAEGGEDSFDNLQGLCRHHHGVKTKWESRGKRGRRAKQ